MAIYVPGRRMRRGRRVSSAKRSAVAVLSLTAMVDMFTVLAVFLLQNYASTGQVIHLPKEVTLPNAAEVKELSPSNVITISGNKISLNAQDLVELSEVRASKSWLIEELRDGVVSLIAQGEKEKRSFVNKARQAVNTKLGKESLTADVASFRKITIQADRSIDFLSLKKVMYTVTEAGIYQINFAVLKRKVSLVAQ